MKSVMWVLGTALPSAALGSPGLPEPALADPCCSSQMDPGKLGDWTGIGISKSISWQIPLTTGQCFSGSRWVGGRGRSCSFMPVLVSLPNGLQL